jgi:glutaredoxin
MHEIVVYSQSSCASCNQVERFLREQGATFTVKDIGADPEAMEEFLPYGFLTTPVTVVDGTPVAGFQPKRLASLLGDRQGR